MPFVKVSDLFSCVLKKHSENYAVSNFETLGVSPGEEIHEHLGTVEESDRPDTEHIEDREIYWQSTS